ncbi:MAG: immunity 26/phosphotriesterase HocA family protein [Tannerellaceae bacterium]|nr:immunity 26/phosphotriesterase HocA family protein [Tannerellaceae bacterium]
MENILTNSTRVLLGLKPIDPTWTIIGKEREYYMEEVYDIIYFCDDTTLHKVIYREQSRKGEIQIECDTSILLDEEQSILTKRGKSKPLMVWNVKLEKSKEPRLSINFTYKTVLVECGVKWLPELPFADIQTIDKDILSVVKEKYGESVWQKKVSEILKKPKIRQTAKEGDIFCVRWGANQYVYGLLIGILAKLIKKDYWPPKEVGAGHYFNLQMWMPVIIRMFNFVSDKNDLALEEITKHELLNPEIIMDASFLEGNYKIVTHKKLVEDDILMPMRYSFYGKMNPYYGSSTAAGLAEELKWNGENNTRSIIELSLPAYYKINIVFNWGFGSVEMDANEFLRNKDGYDEFVDLNGTAGGIDGLDENGQLINPPTIFSEEKILRIFQTMGIDCEPDFDAFNKKYGGITRKQYLESIK